MLYICLSFDYELFLGKNNKDFSEILFNPTKNLIDMLYKNHVPATFFADVLSSMVFKEHFSNGLYWNKFENQLQEMVLKDLDPQLHIHSNWCTSKFENNNIEIGKSKYNIHDFGLNKDDEGIKIIKNCIEYLNSICKKANSKYKCVAYRAGGFCVQPVNNLFKCLKENGVNIDSSVVPHMFHNGPKDGHNYDFRRCPKKKINWFIDYKKDYFSETFDSSFGILEIPMATTKFIISDVKRYIKNEISLPPSNLNKNGSYFTLNGVENKTNIFKKIYNKTFGRVFKYRNLSFDTQSYKFIYNRVLKIYKKYNCENKDAYISLICHPKLADKKRVENIYNFIQLVKKSKLMISFTNFSQINNKFFVQNN